jgi:tetratricopeptide (TPR) repeat protein
MGKKFIAVLYAFSILTGSYAQNIDVIKKLIFEGKNKQASELIIQTDSLNCNNSEFNFWAGIVFKNLYQPNKALPYFKKSYTIDSTKIESLKEMAECCKMTGQLAIATSYYKTAIASTYKNNDIIINAANFFYTNEDWKMAAGLFEELLSGDSSNVFFSRSLARCYENLKQTDKAISMYNKTIGFCSSDLVSVNRLCNLLISKEQYDKALDVSEKYRKSDSLNQRINSTNAYCYYLMKNNGEASERFKKCYVLGDSTVFSMKYWGICQYNIKHFDAAKKILEIAYKQDTTDAQITNYLGLACYYSYYKADAIKYMQRTINLALPDSAYISSIFYNLGQGYDAYDKSKCEDAAKAYRHSFEFNPKDANALLILALRTDQCPQTHDSAIIYYKQIYNYLSTEYGREANPVKDKLRQSVQKRISELEPVKKKK